MNEKSIRTIIILSVIAVLFGGCSSVENKASVLPFLYFVEKNSDTEVKIGVWNFKEATINFNSETPMVISGTDLKSIYPNKWDGSENVELLFSGALVENVIWGRDICVKWSHSGQDKYQYTFCLSDGIVLENIDLGYPKQPAGDDFCKAYQSAVDYDKEQGIITLILMEPTGQKLYIAAIAVESKAVTWKVLDIASEYGISSIYCRDSLLLEGWFYCAGYEKGPVRIHIEDGDVQVLENVEYIGKNMIPQGTYDTDGPSTILPYGVWRGYIIWTAPVCTDTTVVTAYFIFQENTFTGAIYMDEEEKLHVYDGTQTLKKVLDLKELDLVPYEGHDYMILPNQYVLHTLVR